MRTLVGLVGIMAMLAGLYFVANALLLPGRYSLVDASAIQATQIYTMAAWYALLAIAAFTFGILVQLSLMAIQK